MEMLSSHIFCCFGIITIVLVSFAPLNRRLKLSVRTYIPVCVRESFEYDGVETIALRSFVLLSLESIQSCHCVRTQLLCQAAGTNIGDNQTSIHSTIYVNSLERYSPSSEFLCLG